MPQRRLSCTFAIAVGIFLIVCLATVALTILAVGLFSYQRYGGPVPAYSTLSSGFWWSFTQTAGAPASATWQVYYAQTSTAGVPATQTADVHYRQTVTAGIVPSMTGQAQWEQTATAGVPATMTAAARPAP